MERHRPLQLGEAYPNPMLRTVRIPFDSGTPRRLRLDLFDVTGRLVATLFDGEAAPGPQHVTWNGRNAEGVSASAGLYFYRLSDGNSALTRKLLLIK